MKRKNLNVLLFFLLLALLPSTQTVAVSEYDSVLDMPKGTRFKLRYDLTIPANRDFILLGQDGITGFFNGINQYFNANMSTHRFDRYQNFFIENYQTTYRKCQERHRRHYASPGDEANDSNVIISKGDNNTNIIVDNKNDEGFSYSYIAPNNCMKPSFTYSALLLDPNESNGGTFKQGKVFTVRQVTYQQMYGYNKVMVYFDHKIVKGIAIVTTEPLEMVHISQLKYNDGILASIRAIAGINFDIEFPEQEYLE